MSTHPQPQPPRWTDNDLHLAIELAWHSGRDHIPYGLPDAVDDARNAAIGPPTLTHEERVQQRHNQMLRCAAPHEYRGGPVNWNTNRPPPAWLTEVSQRLRHHDHDLLDRARHHRPAWPDGDWRAVHRTVTPPVWWRIWWDLNPTTRHQLTDLAPQGALAAWAVMPR